MVRYGALLIEKTAEQSWAGKPGQHKRWRPGNRVRALWGSFGKIETSLFVSLSIEKNAVYARFWEFSSWTSVLDSLNPSFQDFSSRFVVLQISPKFSGRLGLWKFECDDRIR